MDSLRREREGLISPGAYLALVGLEWEEDPQKKASAVMAILEDSPAFPAAWQLLASILGNSDEQLSAIDRGLSYAPDTKTRGGLLIKKAIAASQAGKSNEAADILRQVLSDPERTLDNEAIATVILSQITE